MKKTDRTQICAGKKAHLGLGFPYEPILLSDRQPDFTIDRRRGSYGQWKNSDLGTFRRESQAEKGLD